MSDGTGSVPGEPAGRDEPLRDAPDAQVPRGREEPWERQEPRAEEAPDIQGAREAQEAREAGDAKIAELEDRWRRALADLDNYRKRAARALDQGRAEERARTSAAWLPVLDDLERALEHAEAEPDAVIQGVRVVLDHARQVIERLGYPRRDDEGEPFDPTRHEAVIAVAGSGAPDGTVVHVVRPGYGEGPAQLRPAQVVVAKGRSDGPAQ